MKDKGSFGECELGQIPQYAQLLEATAEAIQHFCVSIVFDDVLCGSGTLIDAFGSLGILTAHHVVKSTLESRKRGDFALVIEEGRPSRFEIERDCIEHFPLGVPVSEGASPDLSFLKLGTAAGRGVSERVVSTLKSKKSFYRVGGKSFDEFRILPLTNVPWFVSGAPASLSVPMTSKTDDGALRVAHLVAEAGFEELVEMDQHDLLTLRLRTNPAPFTDDYGGVSGGGVWVAPLKSTGPNAPPENIEIEPCHLAGVAFRQGVPQGGEISIFANGPRTLETLLSRFKPAS
jgi:hypothetical protein